MFSPPTRIEPGDSAIVDASELGAPGLQGEFFVRSETSSSPFLLTGALLKHASGAVSATQFPASLWALEEGRVWLATPVPPGGRHVFPEPRAWQQAVDLWRGIAADVQAAHRRGIVLGNLSPEYLYYASESDRVAFVEPGSWIVDVAVATWWPPELHTDPASRRPDTRADVFGLAKLLIALVTGVESAALEEPSFNGIPAYAIDGLQRALSPSPEERPDRVSDLLTCITPPPLRGNDVETGDGFDAMYAQVRGVDQTEHDKSGKGVLFYMHFPKYDAGDYAGEDRVGAFFYENRGRELYDSVKHIWDGAQLNILDGKEIFNSSGERYVTGRRETLPVLEPFWPVSVTDILKAEGCESRYYVDVRDSGPPGRPLVFGKILHGMLDDVSRTDISFDEAYDRHVADARVDMIAAGLTDDDVPAFRGQARKHFVKIAGFARGREVTDGSRAGWTGENVEVTRYSTIFGLEGRIDLVTEDPKVGLQIVELKSGAERDEHVSQLRCYRLLWDGVAQRRSLPIIGYLLYSKTGLLRSAPLQDAERERRILRARNQLVASHRGQFDERIQYHLPYFMEVPEKCRDSACRFRKDRCAAQTALCGLDVQQSPDRAAQEDGPWKGFEPGVIQRAWTHYAHFSRLLELEYWEQTERIGRVLQPQRIWERIASLEAIENATLARFETTTQRITFEGDFGRMYTEGETVLAHIGDFEREHILRGRVVESDPGRLVMTSQGAPNASSLPREGWIIDSLPSRIGFRAAHRAMYRFLNRRDPRLFSVLYAPSSKEAQRAATSATETELAEHGFALNERQREAVNLALTTPAASIIQGPPGTGKTTVIAHIVAELLRDGQRVLLSAQTNTAVDKMLESLLEVGVTDFVRLGDSKRSPKLMRALGERPAAEHFSRDMGRTQTSLDALAKRIRYAPVVGCTTHGAVGDPAIDFLRHNVAAVPFDVAIIDEATQITEPMALGPIGLANRFVLVGDHKQLPPIVNHERASSAAMSESIVNHIVEELNSGDSQLGLFERSPLETDEVNRTLMGLKGLDRSLFERLVSEGIPYVMLEEQYRMHEDVMAFSSRWFYDERLVAHASVKTATLDTAREEKIADAVATMLDPKHPVVFFDVDGADEGRQNVAEADAVIDAIGHLITASPPDTSIGVVTPFRAQGQLIRRKLYARFGSAAEQIDVDTVERYQGSERDVIIVSWVKTRRPGDFLVDERRLNVTLTRARKKLILFGNRKCLTLHPMYRDLIEQEQTEVGVW